MEASFQHSTLPHSQNELLGEPSVYNLTAPLSVRGPLQGQFQETGSSIYDLALVVVAIQSSMDKMAEARRSPLLALPVETLLSIVSYATKFPVRGAKSRQRAYQDFLNLMLACKKLYAMIRNDQTIFKNNTFLFHDDRDMNGFLRLLSADSLSCLRHVVLWNSGERKLGMSASSVSMLDMCEDLVFAVDFTAQIKACVDWGSLADIFEVDDRAADPDQVFYYYECWAEDVIKTLRGFKNVKRFDFGYGMTQLHHAILTYHRGDPAGEKIMCESLRRKEEFFASRLPCAIVQMKPWDFLKFEWRIKYVANSHCWIGYGSDDS